jgi:hypothetical protein
MKISGIYNRVGGVIFFNKQCVIKSIIYRNFIFIYKDLI